MASKRLLKKKVKRMVYEVLDSCDYIVINDSKNADKAETLMDEAVDFHDAVLPRITVAKSKKEFNEIVTEITKTGEDFVKKLNALNA